MQDPGTFHPALVFTVSPTGLAVARSLGPRGVPVWGIDDQVREIGHSSRWFRSDPVLRYLPPGPELLEGLLRFGSAQPRPPVIFVAGDPYIDFVADNHEALRDSFILPQSLCPEVAGRMLDKRSFYEACQALGAALPATYFPEDESDAQAAAAELRYPAIVKPTHGHTVRSRLGGEKLVEVHDAASLVEWWLRLRDWGSDSVLQEVIPGAEENIFVAAVYMDGNLECRSLFTARKNRQYPPWFGSGSYMEASWSQEIADLSVELLEQLEYRGVAGTEFKWDPRDQAWKLIEINPRPTLWFALPPAAGVDVIWDAYSDLVGRPNPVHVNRQDDRVRWQLLVRDLVSARYFKRRGDLSWGELLRTAVDPRRKTYAILSLRDPGTLLAYPRNTLWKYRKARGAGAG